LTEELNQIKSKLSGVFNKMGGEKTKRVVFVTVGTTCFDALVKAVDSETVQKELLAKGYTHLLIQMGRGSYLPTKVLVVKEKWYSHFFINNK
jgi:hypothetical protein